MEVAWAAGAAFSFAIGMVAARRGLLEMNHLVGQLLSLLVGWVLLVAAVVTVARPDRFDWRSFGLWAVAGLIGPGLGRMLAYGGLSRLGAAVSVPIQSATYPLVAATVAIVVLGEAFEPMRAAGVVLVALGVAFVSWRRGTGAVLDAARYRALALPVAAGLAYGLSDILRKQGLSVQDEAALATMTGLGAAVAVWALIVALRPRLRVQLRHPSGARWFVIHGIMAAGALYMVMMALRTGDVSVVSPIIASQPLVVVVLSALLLRRHEEVGLPQIAGVILTVAGSAIVITAG